MAELNEKLHLKIRGAYKTQADFADEVGCHDTFVSMVVNGRRVLDDKRKKVWAKKLNTTVAALWVE